LCVGGGGEKRSQGKEEKGKGIKKMESSEVADGPIRRILKKMRG